MRLPTGASGTRQRRPWLAARQRGYRVGMAERASTGDPDAVIIGAGPNGLVAANVLADAGWQVVVCEGQPEPGGAGRSGRGPAAGFVYDHCSAFYPLTAASRALRPLELERYGLRWSEAEHVLAHPLPDGRAAVLSRDVEQTASALEALGAGDGAAWRRLHGLWEDIGSQLLDALFVPFPPVRAGVRLAARLRGPGMLRFGRFALLPVRRLIEEEFTGPGSLLLASSALHADLMPASATSSICGRLLTMLGHQYGWPVAQGGAGQLTAALLRRLTARGGQVRCGDAVRQVVVRRGRAVAVRTASGEQIGARRAVLAAVAAPLLYGNLVSWDHLPSRLRDDMHRFAWDHATFKVDWALREPVPWRAPGVAGAGTVHIAGGLDAMTEYSAQIAMGRVLAAPGRAGRADDDGGPEPVPCGYRVAVGVHPPAAAGARRCGRRSHRRMGREGAGGVRGPDRGADRTLRPGVAGADYRAPDHGSRAVRGQRRQPGRRRAQRRHQRAASAAHIPSHARAGPARDADRRAVPGVIVRPPGGRGTRRACGANAARVALSAARTRLQRAAAAGVRSAVGR